MNNNYKMPWGKLEEFIKEIGNNIPSNIKSIHGLPRGGLVPAVMLSHETGLPLSLIPTKGKTLIVDDIYETGRTLDPYLNLGFDCCVLYSRKRVPGLKLMEVSKRWIQFPWENKESSKIDYLEDNKK